MSPTAVPSYRKHKSLGQAVGTVRLGDGQRRDVYLGKHNSAASRKEYARIVAELAVCATPERAAGVEIERDQTVNEICARHLDHARQHGRRAIDESIDYYRLERMHSALGSLNPTQFERPTATRA